MINLVIPKLFNIRYIYRYNIYILYYDIYISNLLFITSDTTLSRCPEAFSCFRSSAHQHGCAWKPGNVLNTSMAWHKWEEKTRV